VKIFDMASDGNRFTLVMPTKNSVIEGPNDVHEKSANPLENLRPDFFLDAIVVRGLEPDNDHMVAQQTETVEDAQNKHLYAEPEYVLNVMRRKADHEDQAVRTVIFHRDDMLPYVQYIYDNNGAPETQITYSNYQIFTAGRYPSKITIKRPQEGIQLVLSVLRIQENVDLPPDQFDVKIPEGATVKTLK
jgi:outer membrane lipoprotein-sorting protein